MKYVLFLLLTSLTFSCKKKNPLPDGCPVEQRIGCRCNDGTGFNFINGKTYSGECNNHGGVAYWHCN